MTISEEAAEAAAFAVARNYGSSGTPTNTVLWNRLVSDVRTALEAAAPHIAAEAWDEGEAAGVLNLAGEECPEVKDITNPYRSQA